MGANHGAEGVSGPGIAAQGGMKGPGNKRNYFVAGGTSDVGVKQITFDVGSGSTVKFVAQDGLVIVTGLPTANPEVAGALWSQGGVLRISSGVVGAGS